jgi:hypothetical protein
MKKHLFLVFLVLFACGSPQENDDLINEQEIEKQNSYSDIAKELIDEEEISNLDTENPYIVFKSVRKSSDLETPSIIVDAKWEKVKAIYIFFSKDCVLKKETPSLNSDSITTLEISVRKNDYKSCSEQSSASGLQIQSSDNKNLVLLPDNTLHEGTYSSLKQLNSGDLTEDEIQDILFCCHTFDFTSLDNVFNQMKTLFVLNSTTTTLVPTTSTTVASTATSTSCEFSNELSLKLTASESSSNDGIVSSDEVITSTYSLRNIPYAELISINKNNGIITSIDVCHNKLEQIEIFSLNPYCFYRIKDITYSSSPVLETLLLPNVLPNNKDECIQENSNSLFKGTEVRFMTRTKSPSMSTNVEENGTVSFYRSQTTTEKCCISNTFVDIKY